MQEIHYKHKSDTSVIQWKPEDNCQNCKQNLIQFQHQYLK